LAEVEDRYRGIIDGAAQEHRLVAVTWELTYRCNTRCRHCYLVKPQGKAAREAARRELDLTQCVDVLDQLAELGVLSLTLTGGEIFLRPDCLDIVREARQRRFAVYLKTNGTLITPELADRIAELYVVQVDISLYGARPATHDGITQMPGSFERVVDAFGLLQERGVRVAARTLLMGANVHELEEMRRLVQDLGARFGYNPNLSVKDNGCESPLEYGLSDGAFRELWSREPKVERPEWGEDRYSGPVCSAGLNRLCIGPDGDVYPCVQLRLAAGNLKEQPLADIWRDSSVLRQLREFTWLDLAVCHQCQLRDFCLPCVGQAWVEHGSLRRPSSVVCRQTRLRSESLVRE
jgi:radical SAM protein with 4Fe4S-binding SPASM domain